MRWIKAYTKRYGATIHRLYNDNDDLVALIEVAETGISYRMDLGVHLKWISSNSLEEAIKNCEREYIYYLRVSKINSINDISIKSDS